LLLGEPGGERVRAVILAAAMTLVNLAKIVGHFARNGASELEIRQILDPLPIKHVVFSTELAYAASLFVPVTKRLGLSLGDRACMALAKARGVPALTADRSGVALPATLGIRIEILR